MAQSLPLRLLLPVLGAAWTSFSLSSSAAAAARCNSTQALRRSKYVVPAETGPPRPSIAPRHMEYWNPRHAAGGATTRIEGRVNIKEDQLVSTCSKSCEDGPLSQAVEALEFRVRLGSPVDSSLFYRVLRRCIVEKEFVLGKRVHTLTVEGGYESDAFLANHIICMYASQRRLGEAMQVFTKVPEPNTHMWASIILAHAEHGQPIHAIDLYRHMRKSNVKANSYVFVAVLKACCNAADLPSGKHVHADILASSVEPDMFIGSCLVDMYSKCDSLEDARRVFDRMPSQDVVMWNAMIAGYSKHGLGQEALNLFANMEQQGIGPNEVTFVCLLKACAAAGALHRGKQLHSQLLKKGLEGNVVVGSALADMYCKCGSLDDARRVFDNLRTKNVVTWTAMIAGYAQNGLGQEALALYAAMEQDGMSVANNVTFVCLLQACASIGALQEGKQVHAQILQRGLGADVVLGNCLVDMYAKCGSLEDARTVFDGLLARDVVTWNAMIAGYSQHGLSQEALKLHASMRQEHILVADSFTFVSLLKACALVGALAQGKQLHAQIQESGLEGDVAVGNCLVDMYAKCGSLGDARRVFDNLQARNVVTWNALLNGYARHSDGNMALQCFKEMQQQGVEPNDVTFICLLVACSHEGLVHEGQNCFQMMKDCGIAPSVSHYNCMVDLFGRSGRLDEAEEVLQTMPFEVDVVGLTSLLGSCKLHGNVERGRQCFDHLVTLEPDNGRAYVLMASIYADAGMFRDAQRMESLRKYAGVQKKPAKAWIEVRNKVQEFTVGENRADISSKLRSVNSKLKKQEGHRPQAALAVSGEEEDALCGHAEKLALAYGLMNTPHGKTLLVTKNLRMCNECHSSTKIMSRLEKREIVVRDAHRVHRFVDGFCSCGDRH